MICFPLIKVFIHYSACTIKVQVIQHINQGMPIQVFLVHLNFFYHHHQNSQTIERFYLTWKATCPDLHRLHPLLLFLNILYFLRQVGVFERNSEECNPMTPVVTSSQLYVESHGIQCTCIFSILKGCFGNKVIQYNKTLAHVFIYHKLQYFYI